jgi:hypothetical protein
MNYIFEILTGFICLILVGLIYIIFSIDTKPYPTCESPKINQSTSYLEPF